MIDLNNTWCEATEDNYNKLVELGYKKSDREVFYCKTYIIGKNSFSENQIHPSRFNYKQIHLVDGEFYYVDEKNERIR